jgi:uncharacterized protein (TIGR03435 family)
VSCDAYSSAPLSSVSLSWAASGQPAPESKLAFEVASVKPHVSGAPGSTGRTGIQEDAGQIQIENLSLRTLIAISFDLKERAQLVGPGWLSGVRFAIAAEPPAGYKREQLQYLLRNLWTDRFKLSVHHETKPTSAFALVVAKGVPKLPESAGPKTYLTGRHGLIEGKQRSMAELADTLTNLLGERVVAQTALSALYDLQLKWTPDASPHPPVGADGGAAAEPELSLFTALQEQLGLRLESQKLSADIVVVDHIEREPTEN